MDSLKTWASTLVKNRVMIGRRLVAGFPNATTPHFSIIELPEDSEVRFEVVEESGQPGPSGEQASSVFTLKMVSSSGKDVKIASFSSRMEALVALNRIQRKFSGPIVSALKWVVIIGLALFAIEALTTPSGSSKGSQIPGLSSSESEMAQKLVKKYEQSRSAPKPAAVQSAPSAQVPQEAATAPAGGSDSDMVRSFLGSKK